MKYVIAEVKGIETPFIFPDFVDHSYIFEHRPGVKIISAGMVDIPAEEFHTHGSSTSLKVKSRPEDSDIIKHAFLFTV